MALTDRRAGHETILAVQRGARRAVYREPGGRLVTEQRAGPSWRAAPEDATLVGLARGLAPALRTARGDAAAADPELLDALRALGYVQ
jgi:hypothetical protein